MSKRRKVTLSFRGKTAVFAAESSTGAVVGIPLAEHPDQPHLTLTKEGRRVGRHITFESEGAGPPLSLGTISDEEVERLRSFILSGRHPWDVGLMVWIPTAALMDRLAANNTPVTQSMKDQPTAEMFKEFAEPDLEDRESWTPTTLGNFDANSQPWAVCREGNQVFWLVLWKGSYYVKFTPTEMLAASPMLRRVGGLDVLMMLDRPSEKTERSNRAPR